MENYINPNSMYPLQTADANSPAFGSGTVPGSFLAGALLPQRMQDYRGALDQSMEAGRLSNLSADAHLKDYLAGQGARTSGYDLQTGQNQNKANLLPGENTLAMGGQQQDIANLPQENAYKAWQAASKLPKAQRDARLGEMVQASDLLRGVPENADPGLQLQWLENGGVDVSHFKNLPPQQQQAHLQFLRKLDPKVFEHMSKMEEIKATGAWHKDVADIYGKSRERVAEIKADYAADIMSGKMTEQQLFLKYTAAMAKPEASRDVLEQSLVDHYADYKSLFSGKKAVESNDAKAGLPAAEVDKLKEAREMQKNVKERFLNDKKYNSYKLGPWDPDKKAYRVYDPESGKLLGYYD